MDKYVILGNVLAPSIFQQWIDAGEIINPSHQQYVLRLSKALASQHPVQVVSLPPLRKTAQGLKIPQQILRDEDSWFLQFSFLNHRLLRPLTLGFAVHRYLKHLMKRTDGFIYLFVDGNSSLAYHLAKRYRRHPKIKQIGIFTDDPRQLTGMKLPKAKRIIRQHQHHDAYLAITDALANVLNPLKKPTFIIPGMVESLTGAKQHPRPYLFFSGALYPRYGVEAMVKGFLAANLPDFDLLIAGFGPEASMIERLSQAHRQIKYLGLLTPNLVQKYQAGAYANLNPRPLDPTLDPVAIPSKVFDYLAAGVPCLSTRHPFFETHVPDQLIWIEEASEDGIRVALQRMIQLDYALLQSKANQAKDYTLAHWGIAPTGQALVTWLNSIK
jgi:glycosyltransferase involved in cell wall biosynthesis